MASTGIDPQKAAWIPPESLVAIDGKHHPDGEWRENLGVQEVRVTSGLGVEYVAALVQQYGDRLVAVDDGNPTTAVAYEVYDPEEHGENYVPLVRGKHYEENQRQYIVEGNFSHPEDPEEGPPDAPTNTLGEKSPHYDASGAEE